MLKLLIPKPQNMRLWKSKKLFYEKRDTARSQGFGHWMPLCSTVHIQWSINKGYGLGINVFSKTQFTVLIFNLWTFVGCCVTCLLFNCTCVSLSIYLYAFVSLFLHTSCLSVFLPAIIYVFFSVIQFWTETLQMYRNKTREKLPSAITTFSPSNELLNLWSQPVTDVSPGYWIAE